MPLHYRPRDLPSENFKNFVNDAAFASLTHSYRDDSIDPRAIGGRRFEKWGGPQVVLGSIHELSAGHARIDFGRTVPNPTIRHENELTLIGLQHHAHVLLRRSVGAQEQQIRADHGKNASAQAVTGELATRDREDSALTRRRIAKLNCRVQL